MKKILLGNEAVVKGALASGVNFVSGYPGCPSAEIGDEFGKIAKDFGIYAEWATNEKVALESAIGASFSGLKSLVNMKSFGINVCSDSLFPLAYTGTKAPMVIFVGDDPSCHSSAQTEQDSRGYAYLSKIPILDPSDVQECYDFTKLGFEISEKFNIPVILRPTTRVAHQRAQVICDEIPKKDPFIEAKLKKGIFEKNPHQFCTMPPRVLEMEKELIEKIKKIKAFAEKSKANFVTGKNGKIGIITTGASYLYVMEALKKINLDIPVLKLGFFYPLPENLILKFLKDKKDVLVVEELNPYLEKEITLIAQKNNLKILIKGKELLGEGGEMNMERAYSVLAKFLKTKKIILPKIQKLKVEIPRRTARLCEGCPYWHIFPVVKRLAPEGTIFGGDIGCNMIAGLSPHNIQDYLFSMGASMGISHGVSKSSNQKVISIIGDGTFFHSGIHGLINIVYNKSNPLILILDNRITAMTGHQQNPGMGKNAMNQEAEELKIEEIVKACGIKNVKVLDPINMQELESTIKDFLQKPEASVIVCKRMCALLARRNQKNKTKN
jgi:indolepyruvate ferredoxin oxidoreductase alpha subunit